MPKIIFTSVPTIGILGGRVIPHYMIEAFLDVEIELAEEDIKEVVCIGHEGYLIAANKFDVKLEEKAVVLGRWFIHELRDRDTSKIFVFISKDCCTYNPL